MFETLFELFAKQFEIARLDESREGPAIQVLDIAEPPARKSKPKRALTAIITSLATGFILLVYVFVRAAVRRASSDPSSAAKMNHLQRTFVKAIGRS